MVDLNLNLFEIDSSIIPRTAYKYSVTTLSEDERLNLIF